MAKVPAHFIRRAGIWTYRRRVPADVKSDMAFRGREHFHKSLGTADLNDAKRQALDLSTWFDAQVARVRGIGLPTPKRSTSRDYVLTDDDLIAIQAGWWNDAVRVDASQRYAAAADPNGHLAEWMAGVDDDANFVVASFNDPRLGLANRQKYITNVIHKDIEMFVEAECGRRQIVIGSRDYMRIRDAIAGAELDVTRSRFQRSMGEVFVEPFSASVNRGVVNASSRTAQGSWTLRRLSGHCLDTRKAGASWRDKVKTVVGLFEEFLEKPKAIADITRKDISDFVELARNAPDRARIRFPGVTLRRAVELNRSRPGGSFRTISPNTVRDTHFAVLRWLLSYAHANMSAIATDPTSGIRIDGAKKKGGSRAAFTMDELNLLFRLPMFSGCRAWDRPGHPGTVSLNDHRFWTPLIMLYTGARPSEIAQLAVSDAKLEARHPYLSILTEYDENDPEDRPYVVTFKTDNARRDIPIHAELMRLGFGDYVARIADSGAERLFPEWKLSGDPRKLYSTASWVRSLNGKYIPTITKRQPRPTLYSLRHTAKTQMVDCGLAPQIQNQLLGHAKVGMDANYLSTLSVERLSVELAKLKYPDLDIEHLNRSIEKS